MGEQQQGEFLVGHDADGDVVIDFGNHNGCIYFTPGQARHLAEVLKRKANEAIQATASNPDLHEAKPRYSRGDEQFERGAINPAVIGGGRSGRANDA